MTLMSRPETPAKRCANKVQSHAHMWKTQSTLINKEKEFITHSKDNKALRLVF